jgi:hypothetical protein
MAGADGDGRLDAVVFPPAAADELDPARLAHPDNAATLASIATTRTTAAGIRVRIRWPRFLAVIRIRILDASGRRAVPGCGRRTGY